MPKKLIILPVLMTLILGLSIGFARSTRAVSAADVDASLDLILLSSPTSCYCDGLHLVYDLYQGFGITGHRIGCATEPLSHGSFLSANNPIPPSGSFGALVAYNSGHIILTKLRLATKEWAHYAVPYAPGDPPLASGNFVWGATCPFAPFEGASASIN